MSSESLTKEHLAFLEECNLEFSERYTDSDLEYKKIFDLGIPSPPIMYPWYGKTFNRDRGRGNRQNDYRNRNQNYRNDDSNRNREHRSREGPGSSYNNHHRERYSGSYGDSNRDFGQRDRYRPY